MGSLTNLLPDDQGLEVIDRPALGSLAMFATLRFFHPGFPSLRGQDGFAKPGLSTAPWMPAVFLLRAFSLFCTRQVGRFFENLGLIFFAAMLGPSLKSFVSGDLVVKCLNELPALSVSFVRD